jgi:Curli production assembly/transport component CsgG.
MTAIRKTLLFLLCSSLLTTNIHAQGELSNINQERQFKVAVFDPVGKVEEAILQIVREEISSVLVNRKGYTVLERQLIDKVLEENKFQGEGMVDESQISEIGKIMGADYVFISSITPLNDNYYLSCKMIEVATARIEKQFTGTTQSGIHDITLTSQFVVRRLLGDNITQQTVNVAGRTDAPASQPSRQTQSAPRQSVTAARQNQNLDLGLLSARGIYVYSNNKRINPTVALNAMSVNPEAFKYYKSALKKRKTGRFFVVTGFILIGAGIVTEIAMSQSEVYNYYYDRWEYREFTGIALGVGAGVGLGFIIPGFGMQSKAKKYARRAVDIFNKDSGFSYNPPSPPIEFEFGLLQSGNVGFAMKF